MNKKQEVDIIVNDLMGTIILIVEDEGSFIHEINDFIEKNYDIFVGSNNLNISIEEIKNYNIQNILSKKLIEEGYDVENKNNEIYVTATN